MLHHQYHTYRTKKRVGCKKLRRGTDHTAVMQRRRVASPCCAPVCCFILGWMVLRATSHIFSKVLLIVVYATVHMCSKLQVSAKDVGGDERRRGRSVYYMMYCNDPHVWDCSGNTLVWYMLSFYAHYAVRLRSLDSNTVVWYRLYYARMGTTVSRTFKTAGYLVHATLHVLAPCTF